MKKYLIGFLIGALLTLISCFIYSLVPSDTTPTFEAEFLRIQQLAELDQRNLTNVVTRPSSLVSGRYVYEVNFPGKPVMAYFINLEFTNHQFALTRSTSRHRMGMADTLVQTGNVVSWWDEPIFYEYKAYHVGLIDGDTVSGRLYGWNPVAEAVGFWRIYPSNWGSNKVNGANDE